MKYYVRVLLSLLLLGLLVSGCGEKQSVDDLTKQASKFEEESKFEEAIHAYEKVWKTFSDSEQAEVALQRASFLYYNHMQDFQKALECHEMLIAGYPDSKFTPQARFMIGYIYANDIKDYEKAELAYNSFLDHHADDELAESVRWELENLGKDVNEQLINIFGNEESNGEAQVN